MSTKQLRVGGRVLALLTLVTSLPLLFLKLPWFPVTVLVFVEMVTEPTAGGSEDYMLDHTARLWHLFKALLLYGTGFTAIFGITGIALGYCKDANTQGWAWFSGIVACVGLCAFESSALVPSTDKDYIRLIFYLPIGLAILCAAGVMLSLLSPRKKRPIEPVGVSTPECC